MSNSLHESASRKLLRSFSENKRGPANRLEPFPAESNGGRLWPRKAKGRLRGRPSHPYCTVMPCSLYHRAAPGWNRTPIFCAMTCGVSLLISLYTEAIASLFGRNEAVIL